MKPKNNGKRNDKAAALSLTVRQAFLAHYPKEELSRATVEKFGFDLVRWERLAGDPPIGKVTNETLEAFRIACLKDGYSPQTINSHRGHLRALFRKFGPAITGNPTGLGILPSIPYMRPTKVQASLPQVVDQMDLSKWYIATQRMTRPRWGGAPPFWWQALFVMAYFTGMRKGDIFRMRYADIDVEKGAYNLCAQKTRKKMRLPLHSCVLEHIERIRTDRELIFGSAMHCDSGFNKIVKRICRYATIEDFCLHSLRRTAASEIERVKSGMASVLLQHAKFDVTSRYLNQVEELRECIEKMRVPIAFKHGPKQAERQIEKQRREAADMMKAAQFAPGGFPDRSEWAFEPFGFSIRGVYVPMKGHARQIIEALATAPSQRCSLEELANAVWCRGDRPDKSLYALQGQICDCLSTCRQRLRQALHLPPGYDPVPCLARGDGHHGTWGLYLPATQRKDGAA